MLGFHVSERTFSRWMRRAPRDPRPAQRWLAFLRNHREVIGAMDFFTVPIAVRSMAIRPIRTSFQSPWQNGVAELWVESCRRDLLDHVIAVNERHLKRLLADYVRYYHEDRTHLGLKKETPAGRIRSVDRGVVVSQARVGGLHHRYDRAA
jgi:putative transposase